MQFATREEILEMTPLWTGERFEDGRPKVPDRYLDALYGMTLEELWKPIFVQGYEHQFVSIRSLHPEFKEDGTPNRKLVGRAVTAVYAPSRPDYEQASMNAALREGRSGRPNQWVVDSLVDRDVLVVDMFDKVYKGTFLGGNLTTALRSRTGSGGAVIWGGIRDVEQMQRVPDVQVYYRGIDPTPIREFVMLGMNRPARIGDGRDAAICLPGDVVYGGGGGVLFIPPHLVKDVVEGGVKTQAKDLFGFEMLTLGRFTTAQIDQNVWSAEMLDMLTEFIRTDARAEAFRGLDWTREYEMARRLKPGEQQSAL